MYSQIFVSRLYTVSVPRTEQFSESFKEPIISKDKHFTPNGGYCVSFQCFSNKNWGISLGYPPVFSLMSENI